MRKYSKELVDDLLNSNENIVRQQTNVILKRTGKTQVGRVDPWEKQYHIMKEVTPKNETDGDFICSFREVCGSHNYNLNEKEVYTKYISLYLADYHSIGLWYYYLRHRDKTPRPCLIYIHGGGWAAGSVYTMENHCKLIAELADAVVFNIDYTLAPEGHYPVSFGQLRCAISYIYKHAGDFGIDREKIMIAGDSAGGNLAAALTLREAKFGVHQIAAQFLIYPCVVLGDKRPPGYQWDASEYSFCAEDAESLYKILKLGAEFPEISFLKRLEKIYVPGDEPLCSPEISPMLAENLSNQAKTFIVTAEYDVFRQQAEFYGGQMKRAGVDVRIMSYCGCYHAFFEKLGYVPQSEAVCIEIAKELKKL
jgi:acetyl esterase/lipase